MRARVGATEQAVVVVDLQDRLVRNRPDAAARQRVVDHCTRTCLLARKVQVPVLTVELHPRQHGHTLPALTGHPSLQRRRLSLVTDTAIMRHLADLGRTSLVLVGVETHAAVLQSALDLVAAGFHVRVLVDAVGSRQPLDHDVALGRMERAGVELSTVDTQLHEWVDDTREPLFQELIRQLR